MAAMIDQDRRLVVLTTLLGAEGYRLGEGLLERVLNRVGVGFTGRDQVRSALTWLEANGMLALEKLPQPGGAELWVATLAKLGEEVARGRAWPGIARPEPGVA